MATENSTEQDVDAELRRLVEEYRDRYLWFMKPDCFPASPEEQLMVLDRIVRHGDRTTYQRVMEIRRWLSPSSGD